MSRGQKVTLGVCVAGAAIAITTIVLYIRLNNELDKQLPNFPVISKK